MLDKPEDINNTIVWNTPFNYGVGFIPSAIVTVGLLGFLAWVAFIGLFVWVGSRALFMKIKDPFSHYLMASSFLVSLYLWFAAIVYIPSITTFLLTFFFTGLFFASLSRESVIREKALVFDNSKKKSFVFIMALILALMLLILWGYKIGERVVASVYASKGNIALSTAQSMDDVEKAKSYFNTARSLANDSTYSLLLANIALAQINGIIQDTTTPVEKLREDFQARYQEAMAYSENAIRTNPRSYEAYVTYGNILAIGASLGVQGHYEQAKASYEKAAELNPKSPLIPYLLAQLEVTASNISGAKTKLGDALTLKPNFIDAIIYLGRIQVGEGKIQDAIASFTVALSLDPQNEDLKTILNTLKTQGGSSATQTSDNQTATSTGATKNATSTNN
jgi:tetratricopeptide (TPR) repeat protein